jgi:hypothetical protein
VQHVALHEGFISGGLAKSKFYCRRKRKRYRNPELKEQAENIKQLLMGKIQNNCK